jgi:hypothetical protein
MASQLATEAGTCAAALAAGEPAFFDPMLNLGRGGHDRMGRKGGVIRRRPPQRAIDQLMAEITAFLESQPPQDSA